MTPLHYAPPTDDTEAPPDTGACTCPKPDDRYLLTIEEGSAQLVHTACGKTPDYLGDYQDLLSMAAVPVRLAVTPGCDGEMWHGDQRCDCDYFIDLTPTIQEAVQ